MEDDNFYEEFVSPEENNESDGVIDEEDDNFV